MTSCVQNVPCPNAHAFRYLTQSIIVRYGLNAVKLCLQVKLCGSVPLSDVYRSMIRLLRRLQYNSLDMNDVLVCCHPVAERTMFDTKFTHWQCTGSRRHALGANLRGHLKFNTNWFRMNSRIIQRFIHCVSNIQNHRQIDTCTAGDMYTLFWDYSEV